MSPPVQMLCHVREGDFTLCSSPRLALFHCIADCKNSSTSSACYCLPSLVTIANRFERVYEETSRQAGESFHLLVRIHGDEIETLLP